MRKEEASTYEIDELLGSRDTPWVTTSQRR